MTESESGDNISALLTLECRNHHYCGRLITHREGPAVDYVNVDGLRRPWTLQIYDGFFSLAACPGGCQHEVAEIPEKLEAKLDELANNPHEDEDSYALTFLGPPRELGRIAESDS
jgi:hypothetical protein